MTLRVPRGVDTAPLPALRNSYAKAAGVDLSTVGSDLQEQLAAHSRRTLMRHHGGEEMDWGEAGALDFAERFRPLAGCLHQVAFCVADQLYPRGERWKPRDGARVRAVHQIAEHLECGLSTANNAMQAAELGRRLPVDRLGTPNVQQLMAIVWTHVKARGWDQVTGWMISNEFTFENTTPDALKAYCEQLKANDEAVERDKKAVRTAEDPHEPTDAVVVEEVNAEPVARDEPEPDDEELRDWRRKQHALVEVYGLLDTAETVVNLGDIPDGDEELRKCLARIDQVAQLVARLRAKATATPAPDWEELLL